MSLLENREEIQFRASAGQSQGFGATPREALDALMETLPNEIATVPIVIWPFNRGDAFFTDTQQSRLNDLKKRQATLTKAERSELEKLVEAAFDATVLRTQSLQQVKL